MADRLVFGENGKPDRYFLDGREVSQHEWDERYPEKPIGTGEGLIGWKKPLLSVAAGVHPDQVKEARDHAESIGVPTDFDSQGDAKFTSRLHRKRYLKACGLHDKSGGYGD